MTSYLLAELVIYGLLLTAELVEALRKKSFRRLVGKYMLWFWLSVCFLSIGFVLRMAISRGPSYSLTDVWKLIVDIIQSFTLCVYLIFRGLLVLLSFIQRIEKKEESPSLSNSYASIQKLAQKPRWAYTLIVVVLAIGYAPHILSAAYSAYLRLTVGP